MIFHIMLHLYCRVLPLKRAAEEKAQAIRAATASSFKSMLQEKGDITVNSRWSRVGVIFISSCSLLERLTTPYILMSLGLILIMFI